MASVMKNMGGEKQSSKGGRYVGGFLQLFDWNAKSRKKLFSGKSDLPEQVKQGKKSEGNFPVTRVRLFDEDDIGASVSIRGGSDYSCASSVTDEEGYGAKAPGVVARLMGLDSLPMSNLTEPYSSPYFDTLSLRDVSSRRQELDFYHKHQVPPPDNFTVKKDGLLKNNTSAEPKNPKILNRPIEKFQTEILPPKSAKSIPVTHHKLLSPIKSPGFIPSKDLVHLMEEAAKIIEPGPQTAPRTKFLSHGSSSSVPLKVREIREKVEASQRSARVGEMIQRPVESNAAKSLKGQSLNKSWNGSVDSSSKLSSETEDSSLSSKNKGRSISLAVQAKVNIQKREGLSRSRKTLDEMKTEDERSSAQSFKSHPSSQKITQKKPYNGASSVLKQNNQKQNCSVAKDNLPSKSSSSTLHGRKAVSGDSSSTRQRKLNRDPASSRLGSRKSSLEVRDQNKERSSSGKNVPRKKRSIDGNLQHERNHVNDSMSIDKSEKLGQPSILPDRHLPWAEESRKKGMDVVSFTFTAPLTRPMPGFDLSRQLSEKTNSLFSDNRNKKAMLSPESSKLSSLGYNVAGGDALSVLLDQKLKELVNVVEPSSESIFGKAGPSNFLVQKNVVSSSGDMVTGNFNNKKFQLEQQMDSTHGKVFPGISTEPEVSRKRFNLQVGKEFDICSSSKPEARPLYDCRLPSPVSILELNSLTESCNSSDSVGSNMTEECKQQQCSSVQAQARTNQTDMETDLSDSASSVSTGSKAMPSSKGPTSTEWELEYVKDILFNVELMFQDYVSGRTSEIINPHLFDQLERKKEVFESFGGDEFKIRRKVLFECVSECLDLRFQRLVGGGSSGVWAKGVAMVRRKERLAEEVYKEIQGWRSLGNSMVDELVDKDMGSLYGRWLDFEADEFELGVEMESKIIDALVDEVVGDILAANRSHRCAYVLGV